VRVLRQHTGGVGLNLGPGLPVDTGTERRLNARPAELLTNSPVWAQYGLSNGALDLSDPRSRCEPDPYRLASLAAVRREAPSRDAQYRACRPGSLGRVYSARRTALRASAVKNSKGGSEREAPGETVMGLPTGDQARVLGDVV